MRVKPCSHLMLFSFILGTTLAANAKLDANAEDSLAKTKNVLTNPAERAQAIKGDEKAQEAHNRATAIGGSPENTQKIYDISADIFDKLTRENGGDMSKLQEALAKGQEDPEGLLKSLSSEQRAAIEKLAKQISAQNPTQKPGN